MGVFGAWALVGVSWARGRARAGWGTTLKIESPVKGAVAELVDAPAFTQAGEIGRRRERGRVPVESEHAEQLEHPQEDAAPHTDEAGRGAPESVVVVDLSVARSNKLIQ